MWKENDLSVNANLSATKICSRKLEWKRKESRLAFTSHVHSQVKYSQFWSSSSDHFFNIAAHFKSRPVEIRNWICQTKEIEKCLSCLAHEIESWSICLAVNESIKLSCGMFQAKGICLGNNISGYVPYIPLPTDSVQWPQFVAVFWNWYLRLFGSRARVTNKNSHSPQVFFYVLFFFFFFSIC